MVQLKSQTTPAVRHDDGDASGFQEILPSLVGAYRERGFDAGYSRGVNDTLAAVLVATDTFSRQNPATAAETRRLLFAFSKFLEGHAPRTSSQADHTFGDGSGI
jgi:hypothetical protein